MKPFFYFSIFLISIGLIIYIYLTVRIFDRILNSKGANQGLDNVPKYLSKAEMKASNYATAFLLAGVLVFVIAAIYGRK